MNQAVLTRPREKQAVLSPSNASYDLKDKRAKYEAAGVREYWAVNPKSKTVTVSQLKSRADADFYEERVYSADESIPVGIFPGLSISLTEIFR
jgi:Uma2 family endonuclease